VLSVIVRIGGINELKRVESINYTLPEETSLDAFIHLLGRKFGPEVFRQDVLVAINGRAVREPERAQIILQDGDIVSLVRAIVGG